MKENRVIIAGAGTMGASLAQVYAQSGYETVVYDISDNSLERGRHLIEVNEKTLVDEGILTAEESEKLKNRISFTTDKGCFSDCCLVVESIVENMYIKKDFWKEISSLVPEDALLATNTSGLHISEIAEAVNKPERFIGQHWLNPPHLLPLCEIVVGDKTAEETVTKMRQLVKDIN